MSTVTLEAPVTIVLAPIDQGVRNVGGRDGACEGPTRLLDALRAEDALKARTRVRTVDVGNEPGSLERDLDALSAAVEGVLAEDRTPLVLGGDHGTTFATVRGAARAFDDVGVCYLDPHFDLRPYQPEHTSGSSFRRLIEEGIVRPERVAPIGIETPKTAEARQRSGYDELASFAREAGVDWVGMEKARRAGPGVLADERMSSGAWCASLDTDAIDERLAPGVSAPGADRFSLEEARAFLGAAARRARVVDVVEYAPRLDDGEKTLRTLVDLIASILPDA